MAWRPAVHGADLPLCVTIVKNLIYERKLFYNYAKMASPAKKSKLATVATSDTAESNSNVEEFMKKLQQTREDTAESIIKFKFNKNRVRIISQEQMVPNSCEGIVYWMSRDSRVQDNWAFLFAQKLALKNEVPLHVCFCIIAKYLDASVRQFHFLLKGKYHIITFSADITTYTYVYIS